uniref:Uncharacterized protein n=1 Tax=Parascaris equorum TaxID=6256 RepID=A0A914S1T3_PAREQ
MAVFLSKIRFSLASRSRALITADCGPVGAQGSADGVGVVSFCKSSSMHGVDNETTKVPLIEPEGSGSEVEEKRSSLAIFFILLVIVLATLLVHLIIVSKFYYIPESLAIVMLGE